jgi:uncharacterized protein involved in type VI secretion and phage assembly
MPQMLEQTVEQLTRQVATRFFGKYRGTVTDVSDPDNNGRIKAQVPAVMGETEIGWALPAFPFAGDGHGLVMLPEVGSMVWIEFEAGNLDFPIWSGGFFLPGQRPAPDGHGARVVVSKNQHQVLLDDDADEVIVQHNAGPEIKMTATAITLTCGACVIEIGLTAISLNNGIIKVGPAGVSLVNGAMSFGVPP